MTEAKLGIQKQSGWALEMAGYKSAMEGRFELTMYVFNLHLKDYSESVVQMSPGNIKVKLRMNEDKKC